MSLYLSWPLKTAVLADSTINTSVRNSEASLNGYLPYSSSSPSSSTLISLSSSPTTLPSSSLTSSLMSPSPLMFSADSSSSFSLSSCSVSSSFLFFVARFGVAAAFFAGVFFCFFGVVAFFLTGLTSTSDFSSSSLSEPPGVLGTALAFDLAADLAGVAGASSPILTTFLLLI